MGQRLKPEWEDNKPLFLRGPGYYDEPEGKDPWGKVWGLTKYAIPIGIGTSVGDSLFYTQSKNITQAMQNMGFWVVPLVGLSATFSSVTFISTNIRGKDDKLNYILGALACMPILHAWKRSTSFTLLNTSWLVFAAFLKKDSKQNNWDFWVSPPHEYPYLQIPNLSLVKEWPRRPI